MKKIDLPSRKIGLLTLLAIFLIPVIGFFIYYKGETYTYTDNRHQISFQYPKEFTPPKENYNATPHIIQNRFENDFGITFIFHAANFKDYNDDERYCKNNTKEKISLTKDIDDSDLNYNAVYYDQELCQTYSLTIKMSDEIPQSLKYQLKQTIRSFSVEGTYSQSEDVDLNIQNYSDNIDDRGNLESYINDYLCINFINNGEFIDPTSFFPNLKSDTLKQLTNEWFWGKICESLDSKNLFVVSVNKTISNEEEKTSLFEKTTKIYPGLEKQVSLQSDLEQYQIFILVNRPLEVTSGSSQERFEPNQLYPLTDIAYNGVLAGCTIEPGNYVSDGVILSCGYGDNGCATVERVKWDLFGEFEYLNSCYNNCDLAEDEPSTLTCQ